VYYLGENKLLPGKLLWQRKKNVSNKINNLSLFLSSKNKKCSTKKII